MCAQTNVEGNVYRHRAGLRSAIVGALLCCVLAGCVGGTDVTSGSDTSAAGGDVSLAIAPGQTFDLNQAAGLPGGGNTVKLHDACMDETIGRGVAVGILTPYAAIFDATHTLAYVRMDTDDTPGAAARSIEGGVKNVVCGNGSAFVGAKKALVKIDVATQAVVGQVDLGKDVMPPDSLIFDRSAHRVAYPVVGGGLTVLDSDSLASLGVLPVKGRQHVFFRSDGDIVSVGLQDATATEYDGATLAPGASWQLGGIRQATLAAYDAARDDLWVVEGSTVHVYDTTTEASAPVSFELPFVPKELELEGDLAVALDYDPTVVFGSRMAVVDVPDRTVTLTTDRDERLKHVDIDPGTGTGWFESGKDNVVVAEDLATGAVDSRVDIGDTAEYGLVAAGGRTWIGNRLGGSTLVRLDPATGATVEVPTGSWPVGAAYSPSRGRVFTWDMLDGTVTVIDEENATPVTTWDIGVRGTTDAIGDLVLDEKRGLLYAVLPELGRIVVVDADTGTKRSEVEVAVRTEGREGLSGPGTLDVAVDTESGSLLAYSDSTGTLTAFAADDDFRQTGQVEVDGKGLVPYPLYVDSEAGTVYLGPHAYTTTDLDPGESLSGVSRVVAVDHERGLMVTAGEHDGVPTLTARSLSGRESGEPVSVGEATRLVPTYAYDPTSGAVFAYAMTENVVRTFAVG
ncbi:MAG: hypothetical protein IT198_10615 [Acidimicrobiia bacterium]|nr:hypothetical protein [Acidimicrobiia bacterium]